MFCVFFFKQKTAYEMRISDWSSDVCSSDLRKFAEVKTLEFAHAFSVPLGNGRQAELWRGRIRRHHKESAARADAFCKAGDRIPHLRDGLQCENILQRLAERPVAELPLRIIIERLDRSA